MADNSSSIVITPAADACRYDPPADPCLIVIFGASGDLTSRKIIPSLYRLFLSGLLPRACAVLGCSRTGLDDASFRSRMKEALAQSGADMARWGDFSKRLHYRELVYEDHGSYEALARTMAQLSAKHATGSNSLYYLATPPFVFETVIGMLGRSGLAAESAGSFRRIIVEKPFGTDLKSAVLLDRMLGSCFAEQQIYRIDHYLAKETVQNILAFRFANALFEPLWNSRHIAHVDIRALEAIGVGGRAGYYDRAGILRDMFQNHMLQLLSLVAMEQPEHFQSESVRNRKAKLFQALRPIDRENIEGQIVLGQYSEGFFNGQPAAAYRQEQGVQPESVTPTFASMKVFIDNRRWQGVPFYLTSGKRMDRLETKIIVQFRDVKKSLFTNGLMSAAGPNQLTFSIQPQEKITLSFRAKNPGPVMCLRPIDLEFTYGGTAAGALDAYEKVLLDCLNGDQMLSLRQDSEELCWAFLTPLIEDCEQCVPSGRLLHFYPAGSPGPVQAQRIREP